MFLRALQYLWTCGVAVFVDMAKLVFAMCVCVCVCAVRVCVGVCGWPLDSRYTRIHGTMYDASCIAAYAYTHTRTDNHDTDMTTVAHVCRTFTWGSVCVHVSQHFSDFHKSTWHRLTIMAPTYNHGWCWSSNALGEMEEKLGGTLHAYCWAWTFLMVVVFWSIERVWHSKWTPKHDVKK